MRKGIFALILFVLIGMSILLLPNVVQSARDCRNASLNARKDLLDNTKRKIEPGTQVTVELNNCRAGGSNFELQLVQVDSMGDEAEIFTRPMDTTRDDMYTSPVRKTFSWPEDLGHYKIKVFENGTLQDYDLFREPYRTSDTPPLSPSSEQPEETAQAPLPDRSEGSNAFCDNSPSHSSCSTSRESGGASAGDESSGSGRGGGITIFDPGSILRSITGGGGGDAPALAPATSSQPGGLTGTILSALPFGFDAPTEFSVGGIISFFITFVLIIAAILFFFFLLFGGLSFITSGGDQQKLVSSRGTITFALVGLIIAFAAFAIINLLSSVFSVDLFRLELPTVNR